MTRHFSLAVRFRPSVAIGRNTLVAELFYDPWDLFLFRVLASVAIFLGCPERAVRAVGRKKMMTPRVTIEYLSGMESLKILSTISRRLDGF